MTARPLLGRHIVTTRDERGRLDSLLAAAGADVVHVPLISVRPASDGGLDAPLVSLDSFDWLVVTSHHGAQRVGAAAAAFPSVRLGAVGPRTAAALAAEAGRAVDAVPDRHTGADLARAIDGPVGRVLVAQADRADDVLASGLRERGFEVETAIAYRTEHRVPSWQERAAMDAADAVGFASGSAAASWVDAVGVAAPPVVAAIGPTTASVAERLGLKVTHVATDHDVEGLAEAITVALHRRP